ncbi:hypothetical protein H0H93_014146 [Arthromyces matolae]|nr:hypothetical protein H0H93_014146 [Arthromyces matolae]
MLFSNKKTVTLTLLASSLLANAHIHQRDHVNLKRVIKKRAPFPQDDILFSAVAGAGAAVPTFPTTTSLSDTAIPSTSTASTASASIPLSSDTLSPASSIATTDTQSQTDLTTSQSSTSGSVSSTSASTSQTQTTVVVVSTSEQAAPTPTPEPERTSSTSVVTLTSSVDAQQSASVTPQASSNASTSNSTTVTALIAAGASIAAIVILWTVFRKWKLGHSSKFDERLQPIDWRPTSDDNEGLPGVHRRHSAASSFRSAGHLPSAHDHGSSNGNDAQTSFALPDHDFTAGPAHLAHIGEYADLARRGPSPQPQMSHIDRDANTRPYEPGVPLHHQGYVDYGVSRR